MKVGISNQLFDLDFAHCVEMIFNSGGACVVVLLRVLSLRSIGLVPLKTCIIVQRVQCSTRSWVPYE